MQLAIDTGDADVFNERFAEDILWGSPFGAVAVGYEQIHAIHVKMFGSVPAVKGAASYAIENTSYPTEDVAIAYVRRTSQQAEKNLGTIAPGSFDELAMLVLVKRDSDWWLVAALHVPDRRDVYAKT